MLTLSTSSLSFKYTDGTFSVRARAMVMMQYILTGTDWQMPIMLKRPESKNNNHKYRSIWLYSEIFTSLLSHHQINFLHIPTRLEIDKSARSFGQLHSCRSHPSTKQSLPRLNSWPDLMLGKEPQQAESYSQVCDDIRYSTIFEIQAGPENYWTIPRYTKLNSQNRPYLHDIWGITTLRTLTYTEVINSDKYTYDLLQSRNPLWFGQQMTWVVQSRLLCISNGNAVN